MKLLSPQETKDLEAQQTLRSILRAEEAMKLEKEWRLKLAKAEEDFHKANAIRLQGWAKEEEEHIERRKEMKAEIEVLEKKLSKLLFGEEKILPLEEDKIEELTTKLEEKLDELGQREEDVKRREEAVLAREESIKDIFNKTSP